MAKKMRLDQLLIEKGLVASREKGKASIMAGLIFVNGVRVDKPGTEVPLDAEVVLQGAAMPYVSRGGLKLEKALTSFSISLEGKIIMDVGASTGGFTDCALQQGASKVYAVDVGYGQLAWSLRQDARVINMERTNVRYLTQDQLDQAPQLATIDVAFISLEKVLPVVQSLLVVEGEIIALVKPQFEAGREKVGKKGVVRDPQVHRDVLLKVLEAAKNLGLSVKGLDFSPIKGPEGNIEYLLYLSKVPGAAEIQVDVNLVVAEAHRITG